MKAVLLDQIVWAGPDEHQAAVFNGRSRVQVELPAERPEKCGVPRQRQYGGGAHRDVESDLPRPR